jgi:hypothetical protein
MYDEASLRGIIEESILLRVLKHGLRGAHLLDAFACIIFACLSAFDSADDCIPALSQFFFPAESGIQASRVAKKAVLPRN